MPAVFAIKPTCLKWNPPISITTEPVSAGIVAAGEKYIGQILRLAFEHTSAQKAVIVFDTQSPLATTLTEGYRRCLPTAQFIDFEVESPERIRTAMEALEPLDLVILIQSANFRLEAFRLRVELFKRSLKVIEHPHLARMQGQEIEWYINALAYDPNYFRKMGCGLKERIDKARTALVVSGVGRGVGRGDGCSEGGGGESGSKGRLENLMFASGFESAKLNTGDYRNMKNIGGQFPIGEVFTEAKDLQSVNGRVRIFVFADITFMVNQPAKPITLVIEKGRVVEVVDTTPEFEKVLANIRADEGEVWVREFGFGLNRAFTPQRMVRDIGTLERMCGIHLSLGAKHAVYQKPAFKRKDGRHHVDVFVVTDSVLLDDEIVFKDGAWIVPSESPI